MIRTMFLLAGLMAANLAFGQISASLDDENFIVLSGTDVPLLGVDLSSAGGFLVPVPDESPEPFDFLLQNESTQITFGSLPPASVVVDGELTLSVQYTGDITGDDLIGSWGGEELDGAIAFPTSPPVDPPMGGGGTDPDPVDPPGNPVIPEPASGMLLLIGLLSMGAARSSRKA